MGRRLDAARESSLRTGKPILLLIDYPPQRWDRYIESEILPDSALAQVVRRVVWVLPDRSGARSFVRVSMSLRFRRSSCSVPGKRTFIAPRDICRRKPSRTFFERDCVATSSSPAASTGMSRAPERQAEPEIRIRHASRTPSDCPNGIAFIGGALFLQQGQTVFKLDERTGETLERLVSPRNVGSHVGRQVSLCRRLLLDQWATRLRHRPGRRRDRPDDRDSGQLDEPGVR
jgi:hypothetical protein